MKIVDERNDDQKFVKYAGLKPGDVFEYEEELQFVPASSFADKNILPLCATALCDGKRRTFNDEKLLLITDEFIRVRKYGGRQSHMKIVASQKKPEVLKLKDLKSGDTFRFEDGSWVPVMLVEYTYNQSRDIEAVRAVVLSTGYSDKYDPNSNVIRVNGEFHVTSEDVCQTPPESCAASDCKCQCKSENPCRKCSCSYDFCYCVYNDEFHSGDELQNKLAVTTPTECTPLRPGRPDCDTSKPCKKHGCDEDFCHCWRS